jgi:hypothetical protein
VESEIMDESIVADCFSSVVRRIICCKRCESAANQTPLKLKPVHTFERAHGVANLFRWEPEKPYFIRISLALVADSKGICALLT